MDLLRKYVDEIGQDLVIDDFNIKDVQMKLPARKHFWVARLMDAKVEKNNLITKKKELKKELARRVIADSPVKVTLPVAEQHAEAHESIIELTKQIAEYDVVIEYLEKVEKVMSQMSFDISNIVKIQQMEQM